MNYTPILTNKYELESIVEHLNAKNLMNFIIAFKDYKFIDIIYKTIYKLNLNTANMDIQQFYIDNITKFKNLIILKCKRCQLITDNIINKLPNLMKLNCSYCQFITNTSIYNL